MGLLGSAAAFLPWLQVSDPACTCHVGCFLVHHTGGLSDEQASEVAPHGQGVITAMSIPQAPWRVKVVLSAFLRHSAGIRKSLPISCCDDQRPPRYVLEMSAPSL